MMQLLHCAANSSTCLPAYSIFSLSSEPCGQPLTTHTCRYSGRTFLVGISDSGLYLVIMASLPGCLKSCQPLVCVASTIIHITHTLSNVLDLMTKRQTILLPCGLWRWQRQIENCGLWFCFCLVKTTPMQPGHCQRPSQPPTFHLPSSHPPILSSTLHLHLFLDTDHTTLLQLWMRWLEKDTKCWRCVCMSSRWSHPVGHNHRWRIKSWDRPQHWSNN